MRNFPEQFAQVVGRFPERPAVTVRGDTHRDRLTYRELDAMSALAAARLAAAGLRRGDRCAILAENSARWCGAYLAILRLGAIAVPFDTNYSVAQVRTLLADSGARLVVASPKFEATANQAASDARVLPLFALTAEREAENSGPEIPACPAEPSDPAVILYTSGTTADPKGVVLTHGNLLAESDGVFRVLRVDEHDTVLGVLPLFHSLAQMANLLLPFSVGAQVVYLETLGTRELLKALEEEGVSIFACVPQFFYLIHKRVRDEVDKGGAVTRAAFGVMLRVNRQLRRVGLNAGRLMFGRVHRTLGPRMRLLITGGSKFDPAIGRDLQDLGFDILQAYGLTETSGAATLMRPSDPITSVGRILPGNDVRIADRPQAPGQGGALPGNTAPPDGEVLIRGPLVMQGYWNRPDVTADVLKDGWLHTGDLGVLDANGRLTITGRSKEMIVLESGKNIYPEEIEAHYRQSLFIRELCVMGVTTPGAPTSERLHAVVVPDLDVLREKGIVNTQDLMRFELEGLSVSLPAHKRVLGFTVSMDPLPRTTTGKLKRFEILRRWTERGGADPAQSAAERAGAVDSTVPVDAHERLVMSVVQDHAREGALVRPEANLELDLGLDSMERVELLASLEHRFGMRVDRDVAKTLFFVRDLVTTFRGATLSDAEDLPAWEALLAPAEPDPVVVPILRSRPFAAPVLSGALRAVVALLVRPRVEGVSHLPAAGTFVVSPNHQSFLDGFVLGGVLPLRVFRRLFVVGAVEYFETPLSRALARQLNIVPVDPDANLLPAMQAAAFGLRHDRVLMLFPEGERSIDGEVKKFRKGAAILSRHLDVPIVPVAIDGLFEVWPRNRALAWTRLLPLSGHRVRVCFGEPLRAEPGESYEALTARLREAVVRLRVRS